jgi:hypothetical protein
LSSLDDLVESQGEYPGMDPQMAVFMKALRIYEQRQEQHGDAVWKASGWRGMLVDMRKKLDRCWFRYWNQDNQMTPKEEYTDALDSAYDLLNFTAFFIRQVEAGNRDGEWPWELDA